MRVPLEFTLDLEDLGALKPRKGMSGSGAVMGVLVESRRPLRIMGLMERLLIMLAEMEEQEEALPEEAVEEAVEEAGLIIRYPDNLEQTDLEEILDLLAQAVLVTAQVAEAEAEVEIQSVVAEGQDHPAS
jgi:hypothetical protein